MQPSQTCLQALLIMAYNVGRDHAETGAMNKEDGRKVVSERFPALIGRADIGVLSQDAAALPKLMADADAERSKN